MPERKLKADAAGAVVACDEEARARGARGAHPRDPREYWAERPASGSLVRRGLVIVLRALAFAAGYVVGVISELCRRTP